MIHVRKFLFWNAPFPNAYSLSQEHAYTAHLSTPYILFFEHHSSAITAQRSYSVSNIVIHSSRRYNDGHKRLTVTSVIG